MDNDIKLSEVPKITYLNNEVTKSLSLHIIHDLLNIIFEYFLKCSKCNNFFEEIDTCKDCKHNFCKYCYYKYVSGTCCNNCIFVDKKNIKKRRYNCFVEKCTNDAINGDENMPYYCLFHSKNKLLINHDYVCNYSTCINIGYHTDPQYSLLYCNDHKPSNYKILLMEGCAYEHKNNAQCAECSKKYAVLITCSCGLKRCMKCVQKVSFCQIINDETVIKCNRCIHLINLSLTQDTDVFANKFIQFCSTYTCSKHGTHFDNNNYYCYEHKNEDSVDVERLCKRDYCCAIRTTKKFCDVHNEEYIHLHKMANENSDSDDE